jgi:hypothetical protein
MQEGGGLQARINAISSFIFATESADESWYIMTLSAKSRHSLIVP